MAEKIVMPQLGESVTEGTISNWLVKIGDKVNKYDPICEVNTDKVVAEVPSVISGTITEIVVREGETVEVGTIICYIAPESEMATPFESHGLALTRVANEADTEVGNARMNKRYSPAVLNLVQEHGLDLSRIEGTGIDGRITRNDIMKIVEKMRQSVTVQSIQPAESVSSNLTNSDEDIPFELDEKIPVSFIRKTIAKRMVQSVSETPHAWLMVECDVTDLVEYRNAVKDDFRNKEGVALTYFPFFIKAVAEALKEYPMLNSQWADDHVIIKKAINISIAVATDQALFVPVIKNADKKSISDLAREVDELAKKAREGRLTLADQNGGTFTVNNTGSFGSVLSAPIINYPQAAILSVETIVKRPVFVNKMIGERDMVNLCLSIDHRILDGFVSGSFLQCIKQKLEGYGSETRLY